MVCAANIVLHVDLQMSHTRSDLDAAQSSFATAAHLRSSFLAAPLYALMTGRYSVQPGK